MTDNPLFRMAALRKQLGSFSLDVDRLDVHRGEILGLLGPIGAGKTTLLRLVAGELSLDQGELSFDGQSLAAAELGLATRRRITMVYQRPLLLRGTVRFNVEYGLRLRGQHARDDKVDAMLDRLGLTEIALQSTPTLSGGQTQLVALARALVIEPDLLLLDEPTAHLDPAYVARVEETIAQIRQDRSLTVIWATHNLFQVRRVASRAALLLNGELVEASPTEEFYTRPTDSRTADFVEGRMVY